MSTGFCRFCFLYQKISTHGAVYILPHFPAKHMWLCFLEYDHKMSAQNKNHRSVPITEEERKALKENFAFEKQEYLPKKTVQGRENFYKTFCT